MTLSELRQRFNVSGVSFEEGNGGMAKVVLRTAAAEAEVYLHGAHITHFQPKGEKPVLFMSGKSFFVADKPIRGGVPLCWPWFGPRADDPKAPIHGFARLMDWEVESVTGKGEEVEIAFSLHETAKTLAAFPHAFKARYIVTVGRKLGMALEVTNSGDKVFTYTEALHPYFAVSDVRKISIEGLENTSYSERIYTQEVQKQGGEAIRFTRQTDRVYYDTTKACVIDDPGMGRRVVQAKENSRCTVVWNPWDKWPATVPDFGADEWPGMVCVEPANAHHLGVTLQPGERHVMKATVEVQKNR